MYAVLAVALLVAQEHHEGAPASPFEVNFGLFFWTWLVFIALFFVLKKFAWPPILRATEERERRIAHQLSEAERLNAEAKTALEEHQKLLAGAKSEAQQFLSEAKAVAEEERDALLAKTREEQEQLLERARREIRNERERAVTELRREAVDLSLAAASKLIRERLDDETNRRIVQEYIDSLGSSR